MSRRKLWCFRLVALIGIPLLFFGVLELGLRLAGFGYPTSFLLTSSNHNEATLIQNDRFGWRFFGPRMARQPFATSIPREKPSDTIRVFVFGESAAYGDPQPRFGLPRMLDAMLSARHPDKKFEVVNAAMTGINSHVIRPLARDCTEAHADVWVIYMGNNEVVGPFGAGTVFGNQAAPLPLIHALLALKSTRTGQLLDTFRQSAQKSAGTGEWEGLKMFVNYKLAETDPRVQADYRNFNQNLEDIIAAGKNSGAKIVLSTMAVNLKDCAPFASLHRSDLSPSQSNDWIRFFDAGSKAQQSGDLHQALTNYDQAEVIDGTYAELHFRRAECELALNDGAAAKKEFVAARDLDALRFRCDSRLNEVIRQHAVGDITFADGEQALADASLNSIPGVDYFYEHVHLNFRGNYILARALAEKVEKALTLPGNLAWPDLAQCAQRLGYTPRDTQLALSDIRMRLKDVPFTLQANHEEQLRYLTETAHGLPPANSVASLQNAQSATEAALARWSDDAELWEQLGEIKAREGDYPGGITAVQHSLDLVPSRGPEGWLLYGTLLAQEKKYDDAIAAFKQVNPFYSRADWAGHNMALCLDKLGRRDEAITELKHVLSLKPDYSPSWLALGQLYEQTGRTNDAQECFTAALTNRPSQLDDLVRLARFSASRRWFGYAVTNYTAAVEMNPSDPLLRMEAGRAFAEFGRGDEAIQQFAEASKLAPEQIAPHMQMGFELDRLGKPAQAEQEFRQALKLDANSVDAHSALGVCLYEQKKFDDALRQFNDIIAQNPNNPTALHYLQLLRDRTSPP